MYLYQIRTSQDTRLVVYIIFELNIRKVILETNHYKYLNRCIFNTFSS